MERTEEIRALFPITRNKVFLNHAAQSPLPKPVADAVQKHVKESSELGAYPAEWDGGKPLFARLINAKKEQIALVENTSMGMNMAANAVRPENGSKVVTTDLEYPAVVYPFLRRGLGVTVEYVKSVNGKVLLEGVERAVDDKTAALAVSHVEYTNGFRHDLRALSKIAHDHGAYLIVDAIQSTGAIPVDVKRDEVDFLTCACYKWLLSPPGAAYLYVREDLIEKFEPPFVGWASVDQKVFETVDFWNIWNLQLSETASRFEVGSPSMISFIGATEAMKLLLDTGVENVERRILRLTDYLIKRVKDSGFTLQTPEEKECRSGIVNFRTRDPQRLVKNLGEKNIVVSARANGVRVSPHFYNTEEDIDKLMDGIKKSA